MADLSFEGPPEKLIDGELMKLIANAEPHRRRVWISEDKKKLCWSAPLDEKPTAAAKSIELRSVISVRAGKITPLFQKKRAKDIPEQLCFSVLTQARFVDFTASSEEERDKWVGVLQACIQDDKAAMLDEDKRARLQRREQTKSQLLDQWEKKLPLLSESIKMTPEIRRLWMQGLPPKYRGVLWNHRIGNDLAITPLLFTSCLDRARGEGGTEVMVSPRTETFDQNDTSSASDNDTPAPMPMPSTTTTTTTHLQNPSHHHHHHHNNNNINISSNSNNNLLLHNDSSGSSLSLTVNINTPRKSFASPTVETLRIKDVNETFCDLHLFQHSGPYHSHLTDLLLAFAQLRPDTVYVNGTASLAAIMLMNLEPHPAFICFANLLNRPFFVPFLHADLGEIHRRTTYLNQCIAERLPMLFQRFREIEFDFQPIARVWFQCLFARSLPLDITCHAIDCYLCEGDTYLFRFALGLLVYLEPRLICKSHDDCSSFLLSLASESTLDEDALFDVVTSIVLPK